MHGWVPGPRSLRGARTLLGFPSPAAPLSTRAVLSSSEERCFFMPEPGALVLLCTMQIPALLSADVGSARPRRPAPPLRAHRPRAASGSLHWCREAGRGVSARPGSRPYSECGLEKARACFSLATLVTRGPPSPVPASAPHASVERPVCARRLPPPLVYFQPLSSPFRGEKLRLRKGKGVAVASQRERAGAEPGPPGSGAPGPAGSGWRRRGLTGAAGRSRGKAGGPHRECSPWQLAEGP